MQSVMQRIEQKVIEAIAQFKKPTYVLVGKAEWAQLNCRAIPKDLGLKLNNPEDSQVLKIHTIECVVDIRKTKHKSYLRVI